MPEFRVCLEKDNLVFSAAHFITFNGDVCESLHGHNYRVKCEVVGPLDENGYVVDFIALRDALVEIVGTLDHRVVLPSQHSMIKVAQDGEEVLVTFREKRWVFPADNCVMLPIANTTRFPSSLSRSTKTEANGEWSKSTGNRGTKQRLGKLS